MKKQYTLLAAAIAGTILVTASCGGNSPASTTAVQNNAPVSTLSSWGDSPAASSENGTTDAPAGTTAAPGPASADPKTADYSKVDITIPYDSGEEIVTFTNDMLAGKYDGKIVKCEGISARRMNGNAMMQVQPDGSKRGFTWYIVDSTDPDDYPLDDSRCEITGIVGIGEYDVRYLYVLPENVVIKTDSADDTAADSLIKTGVWWAVSEGDSSGYYIFRPNGEGEYRDQYYGIGYGFAYDLNSDGRSGKLTMIGIDGNPTNEVAFTAEAVDDTSFRFIAGDYIELLTYISDDTENFSFYSTSDLAIMAQWYYRDKYGVEPEFTEGSIDEAGIVTVHLYDFVEDHSSTAAWYYIDRFTAKGTDIAGEPVDLAPYGSTLTMPEAQEQMTADSLREKMTADGDFFGVRYLGYIDPEVNDYDAFKVYIDHILDYTGVSWYYPFVSDIDKSRFVCSKSGQELYLIVPASTDSTVYVYPQVPPDEYIGEVEPLYKSNDAQPFLLKCNVSEIYSDVKVSITSSDGRYTEWYPQISGKDGSVVTENLSGYSIYDFTEYDRLAGVDQAPMG